MSLYSIAAASLTTYDDRKRRPAIDPGMIARTLVLCLLAALALVLMHRQGHTGGGGGAIASITTVPGDTGDHGAGALPSDP